MAEVSTAPASTAGRTSPHVVYGTSPVKRNRRTKAQLAELDALIVDIAEAEHPLTVRSMFYRCVSAGAVEKTENEYKAVGRRVLELRRNGAVPYRWFSDGTRFAIRPGGYRDAHEALSLTAAVYRRMLWQDQAVHVEIWSEKDAIRSTISAVTDRLQVPLMIARGYPSESFLYSTAEEIKLDGKHAVIYQLGDHDPSGVDAWRHTRKRLQEFAPDIDFTFERLAVTEQQIVELDLLTRPTKKSDTRARGFKGESVEVDAVPAPILRQIVSDAIEQHIDQDQLKLTRFVEQQEKDGLRALADSDTFGALS